MSDDNILTKNHNNTRFNGHPVIPLTIKSHNIALPVLTDRIKNNNLKNYEKLFVSNILNHKKIKSKSIEFFKFYHPWLSTICKNEEINSFMSYCYNITKITPPPVKISKMKINEAKNSNSNEPLNKNERNYRLINKITRKRLNSVGTSTNAIGNYEQKKYLSIENNERGKLKFFNPVNDRIVKKSYRNSYLNLKKKEIGKNSTITNSDYLYIVDTSKIKNNRFNNSILNNYDKYDRSNDEILKYHLNNNFSTIRGEYKTIKIKKIKNNDKYTDRKIFRDTFRIGSKFKS